MTLVRISYLPDLQMPSSVRFVAVFGKKATVIWACMTMLHDNKKRQDALVPFDIHLNGNMPLGGKGRLCSCICKDECTCCITAARALVLLKLESPVLPCTSPDQFPEIACSVLQLQESWLCKVSSSQQQYHLLLWVCHALLILCAWLIMSWNANLVSLLSSL